MTSRIAIRNGVVECVWDDSLRGILEAIGTITECPRVTDVEFEQATGDWVARLRNGTEIARGRERSRVIASEVEYLEKETIQCRT